MIKQMITIDGVWPKVTTRPTALTYMNLRAHRPKTLCGLRKGGTNRRGLAEGHSLQTLLAPFGAQAESAAVTTPRGTFGPRAVVLLQVKAYSLVQTFGLLLFLGLHRNEWELRSGVPIRFVNVKISVLPQGISCA